MGPLEGVGVVRQVEREAVGLPLPAARDRRDDRQRGELEHADDEEQERRRARIARVVDERPVHGDHARGACHRERRRLRHVPGAPVAELVRDDEPDLARIGAREERVEEDHPARPAEARHVGVLLASPTARVRDEHVPDRHLRALRERPELGRQLRVRERSEPVEERLEEDWSQRPGGEDEQCGARCHDERPRPRQGAHERDEREHRQRGEHDRDGEGLGPIDEPAADVLGREAPVPLVDVAPERERESRDRDDRRDERRERERPRPPGPPFERLVEAVPDRREGQRREQPEPERRIGEERDVERPVVPARPLHLRVREPLHLRKATPIRAARIPVDKPVRADDV